MRNEAIINQAKPFVKWAGGKGGLLDEIGRSFPADLHQRREVVYVEPFVGGGAVLFHILQKYPNIAKDYFYNKKHQTVEIIKLNGSVELAPIVGLAEVIVDIVETGATLRENGLEVLEEICPLSARMVVNQVSMKMEQERINKLITGVKKYIESREN